MTKNNVTFKKIGTNTNKPILSNEEINRITNQLSSSEDLEMNDRIIDLNNFVNNFITEYHNKFTDILAKEKEISFKEGFAQGRGK